MHACKWQWRHGKWNTSSTKIKEICREICWYHDKICSYNKFYVWKVKICVSFSFQYIYRLNIMFRHMPVPRDTSVLRHIIIVCCELVEKLPNSVQRRTFATCEKYHITSFFLFFVSGVHLFLPILSRSDVRPPRVLYIVFMFINRQLFISRHMTVFSVFFVKSKVEFCDRQCEFWLLIY